MAVRSQLSKLLAIATVLAVALAGQLAAPTSAEAMPTATSDAEYEFMGRVFPDPQGCGSQSPGGPVSPYAEGNICATDFLQFQQVQPAFEYMATIDPSDFPAMYENGGRPFAEFFEFQTLHEDFADVLDEEAGEGWSEGLAQSGLSAGRQKFPLQQIKVTDSNSDIPEADRAHFVFSLSIHGIERAGAEGGIRAAEDLITWAATDPDRPLMVSDPTRSVTVGETLRNSVIYFALTNPDGWMRGETLGGGPFYMRYNGNGIDLNRDWPSQGYTFRPYAPHSESESRSFAKVWEHIRDQTTEGRFVGGNDLHGMLNAPAFSYTLIGGVMRPFDKNDAAVNTMRKMWADQETRLTWSPLIKENTEDDNPADPRMYGVQWGTIWDTINYTVTGALGDWFDSPLGLDALGLDNEMALSHLGNCGTGKCYSHEIEQLHVDGNKGLIYAQVNEALLARAPVFRQPGRTAYAVNPNRQRHQGEDPPSTPGNPDLPAQDTETATITQPPNAAHEFDVLGEGDGHFNGGLTVKVTGSNIQAVSPTALIGVHVERFGLDDHDEAGEEEGWHEVNSDYNQAETYLQAGAVVPVNAPQPGRWRVRLSGSSLNVFDEPPPGIYEIEIGFTNALAWPDPGQIPYDVANTDFFDDMNDHVLDGFGFTPVTAENVRSGAANLSQYDSFILADEALPTAFSEAQLAEYAAQLQAFVEGGGNLVLTDAALQLLRRITIDGERPFDGEREQEGEDSDGNPLPPVPFVSDLETYAGHVLFNDGDGPTYAEYDLAKEVNQAGTAEGSGNRRQTSEPVPVGYSIEDGFFPGTYPIWRVERDVWEDAGGVTVGLANAGRTPNVGDGNHVTYGELPLGDGQIRILGGLLPQPTTEYDHPFGLGAYGVTFSGYQVLWNLLQHVGPGGSWRLAGENRFQTATEVALRHWNTMDTVIIASGADFPDALAATPLAKETNAPILLTGPDGLPLETYEYLLARNPQPTKAYVIGGEAVIGEQVIEDLERTYIGDIERLSGADRYETAVAVATELDEITGGGTKAVIATGQRFPDALAAGPVASNFGEENVATPLLLVQQGSVPEVVAEYLEEAGITETLVAGGTNAVSDAAASALPSATRAFGADRYETAVALAEVLVELRGDDVQAATVATGLNFPDALVVGSAGGRDATPTLLSRGGSSLGPAATTDWLRTNRDRLRSVYLAGGPAVLSQRVATDAEAITGRR
jgi:putative cell wall-binding protein